MCIVKKETLRLVKCLHEFVDLLRILERGKARELLELSDKMRLVVIKLCMLLPRDFAGRLHHPVIVN
jgi:hypothetical protein